MMKSCAAAFRAAALTSSSDAPGLPSAILSATLSSNSMASWLTMPMAARRLSSVTVLMSWLSMAMAPLSQS